MSRPPVPRFGLRGMVDMAIAALLAAIAVLAIAQVLARYVFAVALPWMEELLRLAFVWMIMLGAASADHMRVDLFERRLPVSYRKVLACFVAVLSAGLLGLLAVRSFELIALTSTDLFTALPLSVQWLYWSVPLGCGLWLIQMLRAFLRDWPAGAPPAR